jgi:SAM-dependent methyltransferase
MKINELLKLTEKPKLFERTEHIFWDDSHISKGMLEAHLDTSWDGASRLPSTIEASVKWLSESVFENKKMKILDLGCGPGLYASRLAKLGHAVTGIDFSKRSIEYAKNINSEEKLNIEYIYQNYTMIDYENEFDAIILIYCDLGALTNDERDILLKKIYKALKPGGKFVFDTFTHEYRKKLDTKKIWEIEKENEGFWSEKPYLALNQNFHYPEEDTYLDQIIVITDEELKVYRIFDHVYSKDTLNNLIEKFGFKNQVFYSDITGKEFKDDSDTIAVVVMK